VLGFQTFAAKERTLMPFSCGKIRRVPVIVLGLFALCAMSARAELVKDASDFLKDFDRLVALRTEIAGDRDTLAADLNTEKLKADVKRFFADRAEAAAVRFLKAADRKQMKIDLDFKGPKIAKPTKGTGDLTKDATSYITNYDAWTALWSQILVNVDQMRSAVNANDIAALTTACTDFFTNHRSRLEKRLQWQADIHAMKKDTGFKGTGKAEKPPATSLKDDVSEFLTDRAAWETLGTQLETDRNNLRAALSAPDSLSSTVTTFLTDRRAHRVKGNELALDRKQMRKDAGLSAGSKEDKPDGEASTRDLDNDDPDGALEGSADSAGEK
jgi:hypothetical protein